jgi:hypothetical protein
VAAYTQTSSQADLVRVYDRSKLFEPCERLKTRFWDDMAEADDTKPGGQGLYYRIIGSLGWGVGNPAQDGVWATAQTTNPVDLTLLPARFDSTIDVSKDFIEAGKGDGSYSGDVERELILAATKQFYAYADISMGAGYGTGQLATVNGAVATSATVVLAWPEGAFQLRPGMTLDFCLAGTSTVEASGTVIAVNPTVPSVTLSATINLTDLDTVYMSGQYGKTFPNGLRNIVDDGDLAASIDGQARATYPFLSAIEVSPVALEDITEEKIDQILSLINLGQDFAATQLRSNIGLAQAYRNILVKDRTFMVTGKGVPGYDSGGDNESLAYISNGKKMDWKVDMNLPARTLYALYWPGFRKHTLVKADWARFGSGDIFLPKPSTTTYSHLMTGNMYMSMNISHRKYNAQGIRENFKDPIAGDV